MEIDKVMENKPLFDKRVEEDVQFYEDQNEVEMVGFEEFEDDMKQNQEDNLHVHGSEELDEFNDIHSNQHLEIEDNNESI